MRLATLVARLCHRLEKQDVLPGISTHHPRGSVKSSFWTIISGISEVTLTTLARACSPASVAGSLNRVVRCARGRP